MNHDTMKYSPEDFVLRDFRDEDWPGVLDLWKLTGLAAPEREDGPEEVHETLRLGGRLIILEYLPGSKIAGTSWIAYDGRRLHLHHMAVTPEMQGQGLSHLLMKESLQFAARMKKQIKLEVHRSNQTAINLYKKWGFHYLGDYDVYIIRNPDEMSR